MAQMLELMDRPAFCVRDGSIVSVNRAAARRLITPGEPVLTLVREGQEDYRHFSGGCLYLTLTVSGQRYGAAVTMIGDEQVFTLELEDDEPALRPMALAARELREPLNVILAITDSMFPKILRGLGSSMADQMSRVNRSLYQMLRLVDNMTGASVPASPQFELRDVTAVIQELFDQAACLCQIRGMTLTFTNHPAAVYALVDAEMLERSIYSILDNAMGHSDCGGAIDAKLSRRGSQLYITVTDAGSGIAPGITGSVFYRYLRQPGLEDGTQGVGLGMKLVRDCAIAHGGTILLEQPKEGGVRVTMSLTIRQKTDALRSHPLRIDSSGDRSPALIQLSKNLPPELYAPERKG